MARRSRRVWGVRVGLLPGNWFFFRFCLGLWCAFAGTLSLHADEFDWGHSAASVGNWTNPASWLPNGQPNSSSVVTITNGGTSRLNNGDSGIYELLRVGAAVGGAGQVNIDAGALLSGKAAYLGMGTGSAGSVVVTNGTWNNSGELHVGFLGAGALVVDGGLVTSSYGILSYGDNANGSVTVSSGTWANAGFLEVAYQGRGDLLVNGGFVRNSNGSLGVTASAHGQATVTSGTWTNDGTLAVGVSGTGTLIVDGGLVSHSSAYLGREVGSSGSATVNGGTWAGSGTLLVGNRGTGTLSINGGCVTGVDGVIGWGDGSTGTVAVTSGTWSNSGELIVGDFGSGTLNLIGGLVSSGSMYVGNGFYNATVNVSGGTLTTSNNIGLGSAYENTNQSTLNISGGLVRAGNGINLGRGAAGNSSIVLSGSGVLETGFVKRLTDYGWDHNATISLDGGILRALTHQQDFFQNFDPNTVTIGFRGASLDTNGYTIGISTSLSGTGLLTKIGTGTLTLSGSNGYSGGTTVSVGTLVAAHDQAVGTGAVTVEGGNFHVNSGVNVTNAVVLAGGSYSRALTGALVGAVDATSDLGGLDTTARLLAGTTGATTLVTSFSADETAFSDVYHLEGTGTSAFVLELSFASLENRLYLGWNDEGEWVYAVEGNTDNMASGGMLGFNGSYAEFQVAYGTDLALTMGAYGSTTVDGVTSVWAVLNHNSEFAAIPEPFTLLLLPAGLLLCLSRRRR